MQLHHCLNFMMQLITNQNNMTYLQIYILRLFLLQLKELLLSEHDWIFKCVRVKTTKSIKQMELLEINIYIRGSLYFPCNTLYHLEQIVNQCFVYQTDSWRKILMVSVSHSFNWLSFAAQLIIKIMNWLIYVVMCTVCGGVTKSCNSNSWRITWSLKV